MNRTLATVALTAALLVPAAPALAASNTAAPTPVGCSQRVFPGYQLVVVEYVGRVGLLPQRLVFTRSQWRRLEDKPVAVHRQVMVLFCRRGH